MGGSLVMAFGLVLAGLVWNSSRIRQQELVALHERIERAGGIILPLSRDEPPLRAIRQWVGGSAIDRLFGHDGYSLHLKDDRATRQRLYALLEARPIRYVWAGRGKNLGDDWVVRLPDPLALRKLDLSGTAITDRSVDAILEMKGVVELDLHDTRISDAAVGRLIGLPHLELLRIGGPEALAATLVDLRFLGPDGRTAETAGGTISVLGEVRFERPGVTPDRIHLAVSLLSDPDDVDSATVDEREVMEIIPLVATSPGLYRFRADLASLQAGRSKVELSVMGASTSGKTSVWYHLRGVPLELQADAKVVAESVSVER